MSIIREQLPFPFVKGVREFNKNFTLVVAERTNLLRESYISSENSQSFHHGARWQTHGLEHPTNDKRYPPTSPAGSIGMTEAAVISDQVITLEEDENELSDSAKVSDTIPPVQGNDVNIMQTYSHEITVKLDDVLEGDLSLLETKINELAEQFHRSFVQSMFSMIDRSCEATGNTVNARGKEFPVSFMEMLEKIEFGVDRNGEVSIPSITVGSRKMGEEMLAKLEAQDEAYKSKIEKIQKQKTEAALTREAERKSKFVKKENG